MEDLTIKKSVFVNTAQGDIRSAYNLGKVQGSGAFGQVHLAEHLITNEIRAIKKFLKSRLKSPDIIQTEIDVLKLADHPFIVKIHEIWEDERYIYLVMEYCSGGEMLNYILLKKRLTEREASKLFHQLISALNYLHHNEIAHRDIKPENLLFAYEPFNGAPLKICDFGLSKIFKPPSRMSTKVGSPFYMAPEVIAGSTYTAACDIWSCGVILYLILSGFQPFSGKTEIQIFEKIRTAAYDFNRPEWYMVSDLAKDLISNMLQVDIDRRFTIEQILNHPWISSNETLPDTDLNINIDNLQEFVNSTKLKQIVLMCVANQCCDKDIKNLREIFNKLDTNEDGTLSFDEVKAGISMIPTMNLNLDEVFNEIDMDKSGTIDYSEFLAATIDETIYLQEERLYSAFHVFDKDNSGKISLAELQNILGNEGLVQNHDFWKTLVQEYDKNEDEEIDFHEFVSIASHKKLLNLI